MSGILSLTAVRAEVVATPELLDISYLISFISALRGSLVANLVI